jgi:hypothetical protein
MFFDWAIFGGGMNISFSLSVPDGLAELDEENGKAPNIKKH